MKGKLRKVIDAINYVIVMLSLSRIGNDSSAIKFGNKHGLNIPIYSVIREGIKKGYWKNEKDFDKQMDKLCNSDFRRR